MKIRIITLSKVRENWVLEGEEHYLKQLKASAKIERIELPGEKIKAREPAEVIKREERLILECLKDGEFVAVLDVKGKSQSSESFARWLGERERSSHGGLAFVIGGAFGLSAGVKQRADTLLSLSELTFPWQLTRLLLIEQLYRANAILRMHPYHKA